MNENIIGSEGGLLPQKKTVIAIVAVIAIVIIAFVLVNPKGPGLGETFSAHEGLPLAEKKAKEWKHSARLTSAWCLEEIDNITQADGLCRKWEYDYLSGEWSDFDSGMYSGKCLDPPCYSAVFKVESYGNVELVAERTMLHSTPLSRGGEWKIDSTQSASIIKKDEYQSRELKKAIGMWPNQTIKYRVYQVAKSTSSGYVDHLIKWRIEYGFRESATSNNLDNELFTVKIDGETGEWG